MRTGEFLKSKRQAAGLNTREAGTKAGVSYSYIAKIERGESSPTVEVLDRLLFALGVSWLDFLRAVGYVREAKTLYRGEERRRPLMAEEETAGYTARTAGGIRASKKKRRRGR